MKRKNFKIFIFLIIIFIFPATQISVITKPIGGCYQTESGDLCVDGLSYVTHIGWPVKLFMINGSTWSLAFMIIKLAAYFLLIITTLAFVTFLLVNSFKHKNRKSSKYVP